MELSEESVVKTQIQPKDGAVTVSPRKIAANRQNAQKSTGPKTPRGKRHSRRNALKHGLFAMDLYIVAITAWEDPDEYRNLLKRLAHDYQPTGAAEELEVQRIASCWWKLSRVWRYENAKIAGNLCARHAEFNKEEKISVEDKARLTLLASAGSEIKATGQISDELKGKIFADEVLQKMWESLEADAYLLLARKIGLPPPEVKKITESNPASRRHFLLGIAADVAVALVRERALLLRESARLSNDIEAVPPPEILDRVLRAEAAIDKSLSRAIDRLDRLQRRRKGEPVAPSVNVRLTQ